MALSSVAATRRLLTTGRPEEVREHVSREGRDRQTYSGFFFCLVGEAPKTCHENLEAYFDAFREFGRT